MTASRPNTPPAESSTESTGSEIQGTTEMNENGATTKFSAGAMEKIKRGVTRQIDTSNPEESEEDRLSEASSPTFGVRSIHYKGGLPSPTSSFSVTQYLRTMHLTRSPGSSPRPSLGGDESDSDSSSNDEPAFHYETPSTRLRLSKTGSRKNSVSNPYQYATSTLNASTAETDKFDSVRFKDIVTLQQTQEAFKADQVATQQLDRNIHQIEASQNSKSDAAPAAKDNQEVQQPPVQQSSLSALTGGTVSEFTFPTADLFPSANETKDAIDNTIQFENPRESKDRLKAALKRLYLCALDKEGNYDRHLKDIGNVVYLELHSAVFDTEEEYNKAIQAVELTTNCIQTPLNGPLSHLQMQNIVDCHNLAQDVMGSTSPLRIIGGSLLILSSIILMGAAVASCVLTSGFTAPLAYQSMVVAASMMQVGLAAAGSLAVGALLGVTGNTLASNGFQHGVSKQLSKFWDTLNPRVEAQQELDVASRVEEDRNYLSNFASPFNMP